MPDDQAICVGLVDFMIKCEVVNSSHIACDQENTLFFSSLPNLPSVIEL